jgi:transcriptional regulator with XRE-family HTH domain
MMDAVMKNVGRRLREERARLGWSVENFSEKSGIHPTSLGNYERGDRAPNAILLLVWHDIGIDIGYVLVGVRWSGSLSGIDQQIIDKFNQLDGQEQDIVFALLCKLTNSDIDLKNILAGDSQSTSTFHSPTTLYKPPPENL